MAKTQPKQHYTIRERAGHKYLFLEESVRFDKGKLDVRKNQKRNLGRLFELSLNNQSLKLAEIKADKLKLPQKKRSIFIKLYMMGFEWHGGHMIYNYPENKGKEIKYTRLIYDFQKMCAYRPLKSDQKERIRKRIDYQLTRSKGGKYKIEKEKIKRIAIVPEGMEDYIY